jgi:phosphohistidine phosphatase
MSVGKLRLILTRHAKSSWDDATVEDHERPLNRHGHRAARELGDWLASRGYEPEEVLCSTALRTKETWQGVALAALEVRPEIKLLDSLYHAGPDVMLKVLNKAHAPTVMMVGHNPGIAEFAARLAANPPRTSDFSRYPTGATCVFNFEVGKWSNVAFGSADLREFMVPRDE